MPPFNLIHSFSLHRFKTLPSSPLFQEKKRGRKSDKCGGSKMASGLVLSFRPAVVRACATPGGDRRSEGRGRSSGTWWTPLFGWPSEPDYIDGGGAAPEKEVEVEEGKRPPARRFAAFTEEKARELRLKTMEMETFHDVMYHSTIASRLASDLPLRRSKR